MGFYQPWLLLGGLAVAVPLILHFFYRARYRKVEWGAMEFLRTAIEQTSRRLRFQEWILLALRCLVLLLLAFALARPTLSGGAAGRGDAIDAVFIIDVSYSMGARDGDQTRFDRAKGAALAVIDNLPPNSTVQIITCADRATHLGPQSPGNLDQARQTIQSLSLTSLSTDLLPGLQEAFTALDRGAGMNKEVYLFSDLPKSGIDRQSAALRAKADEIKTRATLLLVRCGRFNEGPANAAIVGISQPGGIPHKGARMPFTVLLRNSGSRPVSNVSVTLEVDGRNGDKETAAIASIAPGQISSVTLTALLDDPGPRVVTARLSSDDLPGDNTLSQVINVRDRVNVLIVDGAPDRSDPKESASHFIRTALLPVSANQIDDYFVRVNVVTADEAGPALLAGTDLVILANVPASDADKPGVPGLSDDFALRLAEFVKAGGGLVIGAGENIVPERYNAVLGMARLNLLPFELDEAVSTTADRPFKPAAETIEPGSYLARFRDEPFRTVTGSVDLTKLLSLRERENSPGRVLLRTSDGKPLLASRSVGSGEVLLMTTSLDMRWGNWPAQAGAYLPLVQLTLAHFTDRTSRGGNRIAGEPLSWSPPDFAKGYDLIRPDGSRSRLTSPRGGNSERLALVAPDVLTAGVYRIASDDGSITSPPFAVGPDLRESDALEPLGDAEIEQALGFKPIFLAAGSEAEMAGERSRREWTVWVLFVLFFAATGEAIFAWMCGRAW